MEQVKCSSCNFDNSLDHESCVQCGAVLLKTSTATSPDAAEQLRQMTERLSAINEEIKDILTPVRTTSFNGCGVMLLDYRPAEDSNYEATRWVTIFGFPIIPLSVWKIRPRRYSQDERGERQSFDLLDKRRLTLSRFFRPYLLLALGALPFVLAYYFVNLSRVIFYISHKVGTGVAVGLVIALIILVLVWIGFIMTRFHNAEKAYKQKSA